MQWQSARDQYSEEIKQRDDQVKALWQSAKYEKPVALIITDFKHEALQLHAQVIKQRQLFCEKLSLMQEQQKLSFKLIDELVDMEIQYDEAKRNLNDLLEWKADNKRMQSELPKIDEAHKSMVLGNWKDRNRLIRSQ